MKELLALWISISPPIAWLLILIYIMVYQPGIAFVLFMVAIVLGCVAALGYYIWERVL